MKRSTALALMVLALESTASDIDYHHGYAFLATPRYPAGFEHFDYVNPAAPKGGRIRVPRLGNWDSFNALSGKGRVAAGMDFWSSDENLLWDTLLVPALDEPATHYGLLAEGLAVADDRSWVAFRLRDEAHWHDGKPITVKDVVFTFNWIQEHAGPTIRSSFRGFELQVLGPREFRFLVPPPLRNDPEVPLRLGGIPILPEHDWRARDIEKTTLEPPLGSGPYQIGQYDIGRWLEYERVSDYWARDLPVNRGKYNFDLVKFDYFRDSQVETEAVKGNLVDVKMENVPGIWHSAYDTPAVDQGYLKKVQITLARPAGLWYPVFWNMDQPRFQDLRVRRALWLLNDMDWTNRRFYNYWGHATSFFHGSRLAARGLPGERELELLEPLRDLIPETVFTEPYRPQPNTGGGWSRENILEAYRLLLEAGWEIEDGILVHGETREAFFIRFIAITPALGASFIPFTRVLKRVGIESSIKSPEISNWLYRLRSGDFDAGANSFLPSYTPTLTIYNTFHSANADKDYSSNWSNLRDPAIDALIEAIGNANSWDDYVAALRAFDRVMLHNYYWIPMMSRTHYAFAYWDRFGIPDHDQLQRLAHIDLWWYDQEKAAAVDQYTGGGNH